MKKIQNKLIFFIGLCIVVFGFQIVFAENINIRANVILNTASGKDIVPLVTGFYFIETNTIKNGELNANSIANLQYDICKLTEKNKTNQWCTESVVYKGSFANQDFIPSGEVQNCKNKFGRENACTYGLKWDNFSSVEPGNYIVNLYSQGNIRIETGGYKEFDLSSKEVKEGIYVIPGSVTVKKFDSENVENNRMITHLEFSFQFILNPDSKEKIGKKSDKDTKMTLWFCNVCKVRGGAEFVYNLPSFGKLEYGKVNTFKGTTNGTGNKINLYLPSTYNFIITSDEEGFTDWLAEKFNVDNEDRYFIKSYIAGSIPELNTEKSPPPPSDIGGNTRLTNPLKDGLDTIPKIITAVINGIILPITIPFFAIALIWSGFLYIKARGNPGKINEAHTAIKWTLIGGAVILGAYVIGQAVQSTVVDIISLSQKWYG